MPTSARWAAANLPKISEKTVHPAGAMWASPPTTGACKFALHIHKNILPSRRFGTRAYLLRGATQIRKRLDTSLLRKGCGLRGPGDFGAVRLIRLLSGCPSRCCCKGLSASWPSLWAGRKPVLLPRRRSLSDRFFVFHHDTPIQIAALQSEDQHFGRGQIGRAGDIVRIAQAERAHDALILPRVGVVRV